MKTILTYLTLAVFCFHVLSGCKKETTSNASANNNNDYITFKIDGQSYRMEEQQISPTDFTVGAARHAQVSGKHGLQISFGHYPGDEGIGISIIDNQPVNKPHYDLKLIDFSSLVSYVLPNGTNYVISDISIGTIDFTSIDTTLNHAVEATFQINNLELQDENGDVISTGHTLSEGKLKTKIE